MSHLEDNYFLFIIESVNLARKISLEKYYNQVNNQKKVFTTALKITKKKFPSCTDLC